MTSDIRFTKMHGAGNDYIYVNTLSAPLPHPEQAAIAWSDRHKGIGSDGLVLIGPSAEADFSMRIFNADGSAAMMCGTATRCIGRYVHDHHLTDKTDIALETRSGVRHLHLHLTPDDAVESVTVDMGRPLTEQPQQAATADGTLREAPFEAAGQRVEGTFVSMGNPHLVCFVSNVEQFPVAEVGSQLEHHPLFPERVNVEFAEIAPDGSIRMRVWERGSGITQACGTGACATLVAAALTGRTPRQALVRMDGGSLHIEWAADGHVYMTGEAVSVFEGSVQYPQ